jgi:hypothetical protein
VRKRAGLLIAVTVLAWAGLGYPAWKQWGDTAIVYSAVAMLLCLAPTVVTLLWAGWAYNQSPEQQLWLILGGTGVRMGLVLGVGLALSSFVPFFEQQSFWAWILVFYLLTLAIEVALVVQSQSAAKAPREAAEPVALPKNS